MAGISWVGLLYFFNLVNVPFMKQVDAGGEAQNLSAPDPARSELVSLEFRRQRCSLGLLVLGTVPWSPGCETGRH